MAFNRNERESPFKCCHKCSEKRVTEDFNCHTNCKRYAEALAKNKENKKLIKENLSKSSIITNFDFDYNGRHHHSKDGKPIKRS